MTTHLSTRLVWHDRAWDGHICDHPSTTRFRQKTVLLIERDSRVITSEDGLDGSIDVPAIDRIARKKILLAG